MSYTRKKYKNGQSRGSGTEPRKNRPKTYKGRDSAPPPIDNYLRKVKVNSQ